MKINTALMLALVALILVGCGASAQVGGNGGIASPIAKSGPCAGKSGDEYVVCLEKALAAVQKPAAAPTPTPVAAPPAQPALPGVAAPQAFPPNVFGPGQNPFGLPVGYAQAVPANAVAVNCAGRDTVTVNNEESDLVWEIRGPIAVCDRTQLAQARVIRNGAHAEEVVWVIPPSAQGTKFWFNYPIGITTADVVFTAYQNEGPLAYHAVGHIDRHYRREVMRRWVGPADLLSSEFMTYFKRR